MSLIDFFPGEPRSEQEYVIREIEKAFDTGKRFVIVQAPTGVGKSHVGATLALSTNKSKNTIEISTGHPQSYHSMLSANVKASGAFVLTTTKQLQDQYSELFKESSKLKGKENYVCDLDPTCDATVASCVYNSDQMRKCSVSGQCQYIEAYRAAMLNNFSELNYSMYFSLPDALKLKEILICDEASELEDQIISHFKLAIAYKLLDFLNISYRVLKTEDSDAGYLWICDLHAALPNTNLSNNKKLTLIEIKKHKAIRQLKEKTGLLMKYWYSSEFITELTKGGVCICPLKANKLSRLIFESAKKVVFMSATIINPSIMAESLGLKPDEFVFIDVPSSFDPKKSPIYISPAKYDMRYGHIDRELPKLVKDVLDLCEIHKKDKGIIHTNSFKINEAFKQVVGNNPRFLIREEGVSNEILLREHFERPDATVLISPSLAFGTSLDDEHGRFQVIAKLPYLPMSDKRVKILSHKDFEWYQLKMWIKMIQMCGRCTRSKDDHSATYIFDAAFIDALKRYKNRLPKWFKNRLV